ncbi:MAG: hypothetical protein Q9176_006146 [Flavoplaca citrina]
MWPARNAAQIRASPYNKLLEEERQTQVAFNTEARAEFSEQPTAHGSKPKHELKMVVDRSFATVGDGGAKCDDNVYEFMETETQGHAGVLDLFLTHMMLAVRNQNTRTEHDGVVSNSMEYGRGFWSLRMRQAVANFDLPSLRQTKKYSSFTVQGLEDEMLAVAESPNGYLIHSSNTDPEPMKMNVALATIFPRPVSDPSAKSALRHCASTGPPHNVVSRRDPPIPGEISEAAFQSEMYACLKLGLKGHQISSEFAEDHTGWVDFYVPRPKCWGIELLQNGTPVQIENMVIALVYPASTRGGV